MARYCRVRAQKHREQLPDLFFPHLFTQRALISLEHLSTTAEMREIVIRRELGSLLENRIKLYSLKSRFRVVRGAYLPSSVSDAATCTSRTSFISRS